MTVIQNTNPQMIVIVKLLLLLLLISNVNSQIFDESDSASILPGLKINTDMIKPYSKTLSTTEIAAVTVSKNLRGSHQSGHNIRFAYSKQLESLEIKKKPQSGFLVIENFGRDNTCHYSNSLNTKGIPAGQCLNIGTGKGSFMYHYTRKNINNVDSIQVNADFYDDDNCQTLNFHKDEMINYSNNQCLEDSSSATPLGDIQYLKYRFIEGDTFTAPYNIGYETK